LGNSWQIKRETKSKRERCEGRREREQERERARARERKSRKWRRCKIKLIVKEKAQWGCVYIRRLDLQREVEKAT
jgi:hypothetical protein